jgi:hypothetical protein
MTTTWELDEAGWLELKADGKPIAAIREHPPGTFEVLTRGPAVWLYNKSLEEAKALTIAEVRLRGLYAT